MSKIILSKIIKKGHLIDNYLVNFPLFINKEKGSIYKLVIGLKITCFVIRIYEGNYTIRLPYYLFGEEHALFISWGDGITRRGEDPLFLEHTYVDEGIYLIYILGDTPDLFSISDNDNSYWERYYFITEEEQTELTELQNNHSKTEELLLRMKLLLRKVYLNELKNYEYLNHFRDSLILIKKLCDSLTDLRGVFKFYPKLSGLPDESLPPQIKTCQETFYACSKLEYIPFNFNLPELCTNFQLMFAFTGLKTIFNLNFRLPYTTSSVVSMFRDTPLEAVPEGLFNNITSTLTSTKGMFYDCTKLMYFSSPISCKYITNIDIMFQWCTTLKEIKFNVPSLTSLYATCWGCSALNKVEGFKINLFTKNANFAFCNCISLNQDVGLILEYYDDFNLTEICSTFYNCLLLRGTPKELYLWKSYTLGHLSTDMFYNCTLLNNYNFITKEWGGPTTLNEQTGEYELIVEYWYGSYLIMINNPNEDIYCLPIYKFREGNNNTLENKNYSILSSSHSGMLAPYDFYVNYGDDSAWHHVTVGDSVFFEPFWLNDKKSPLYGYPRTWQINFKNKYKVNGKLPLQTNKMLAYLNLTNHDFFGYIYKDLMHIYKLSGNYKVTIMGKLPRFYVHEDDYLTNRHLFDIYTVNKLPFTSLDHAFTNAINLRYLPNLQLIKFPILSGECNWTTVPVTTSYMNQDCPLYKDYENGLAVTLLSASDGYYKRIVNSDNTITWNLIDPPLTQDLIIELLPITEVTIDTLVRDDLLHTIPTSATNYCFANVYGYKEYLNPPPQLFSINSGATTFKNRKII